ALVELRPLSQLRENQISQFVAIHALDRVALLAQHCDALGRRLERRVWGGLRCGARHVAARDELLMPFADSVVEVAKPVDLATRRRRTERGTAARDHRLCRLDVDTLLEPGDGSGLRRRDDLHERRRRKWIRLHAGVESDDAPREIRHALAGAGEIVSW